WLADGEDVYLAEGVTHAAESRVGKRPDVDRRPDGDYARRRDPDRACARLARAVGPQGGRGRVEIHHHRHVREGGAGHAGRGRGEMGARGIGEDLRWVRRAYPSPLRGEG